MHQKFFAGMKSFATAVLCIGIIATVAVFFSRSFTAGTYVHSIQFAPSGLIDTAICLVGSIAGYYIIKGIALIGLKLYAHQDEEPVSPQDTQLAPAAEAMYHASKRETTKTSNVITIVTIVAIGIITCIVAICAWLQQ